MNTMNATAGDAGKHNPCGHGEDTNRTMSIPACYHNAQATAKTGCGREDRRGRKPATDQRYPVAQALGCQAERESCGAANLDAPRPGNPAGAGRRARKELRISRLVVPDTIPASDLEIAECLLAKMIARAYAADHPHLFSLLPRQDCTANVEESNDHELQ